MAERHLVYFLADVHLGLPGSDGQGREERLLACLKSMTGPETKALYLLGDIWDFWYEYRDVVPRRGARVIAQLVHMMDEGIEVYFIPGNHDMWCYSYFESLGIHRIDQPYFTEIGGKSFCLGHGDELGGAKRGYRFLLWVFRNRVIRRLFSTLHPWLAFGLADRWSGSSRKVKKGNGYKFAGESEPLYRFASSVDAERHVDFFIFGHFHEDVRMSLPSGARFIILDDWIDGGTPHALFDTATGSLAISGAGLRSPGGSWRPPS